MKHLQTYGLMLLLACSVLTACDEGDITDSQLTVKSEGRVAKLTVNLAGMDTWSSQYSLVLAGFDETGDYAIQQKRLPTGSNGEISMSMTLSSDDIKTVELCITNRLRQRIVSFASVDMGISTDDTLRLNAGNINVGMYHTIQNLVFTNTCARCHGLGNTPAAGLSLAEGESYSNLVNHTAKNPDNGLRVVPGDAANSLLHKVIHGDENSGVPFDHSNMIKESSTITLIDNWINNGATPDNETF